MLVASWPLGETAGAVDGVDGDGGESQFLRGLDDAGAAAALVFHLVAELADRLVRARSVAISFFRFGATLS